ncbi:MAG: hypothetical protein Q9P01_19270 [Anaerolineae bacterium]|nr:hypothetical protein [Anaerolineae bacterium]
MPEKKHRNPFEDHINSETFDVSQLENVSSASQMAVEMQAFFDNLPQPLNYELWDSELNDRQKMICAYLAIEIVEQALRVQYAEELQDFSDVQLTDMLMVPVTLAMLAEERLHEKPQRPASTKQDSHVPTLNHPNAYDDKLQFDFLAFQEMLQRWFYKTKDFLQRLFRKR